MTSGQHRYWPTISVWEAATGKLIQNIEAQMASLSTVAASRDGTRVAWGGQDGSVRVWDTADGGHIVRTFAPTSAEKHYNAIGVLAISPDGRLLLAAEEKGKTLKLWDVSTGKLLNSWDENVPVQSLAFTPEGDRFLSAGGDTTFSLWDVRTGERIRTFNGHLAEVTSLAVSADGRRIFSGSSDGTVKVWHTASGALLVTLVMREDRSWLVVTPEGFFDASSRDLADELLVLADGLDTYLIGGNPVLHRPELVREKLNGDPDGKVKEAAAGLDFASLRTASKIGTDNALNEMHTPDAPPVAQIVPQMGHSGSISALTYSPDGRFVLSGSSDKTLRLWDAASGREIRSFAGHAREVASVAFSPDGRFALSGSGDNTLKLWDVVTGKELRNFTGHSGIVSSVTFSVDGRFVLSGSRDKTAKLWNVATGKLLRTFTGHGESIEQVALSPDRRLAVSASSDKTIKLWDTSTGNAVRTFTGHGDHVFSVAFSPDGRRILSGSEDKTMKLWDVASGQELRSFAHENGVTSAVFSADGRLAVAGTSYDRIHSHDGHSSLSSAETIILWDLTTGEKIRAFGEQSPPVTSVNGRVIGLATHTAFSPDGRFVLSDTGGTLRLWETNSGNAVLAFVGYGYRVRAVAFSPDGRLGLAHAGGIMKLWDVATGKELRRFGKSWRGVATVFTPDGRFVLSGTHGDFERRMMDAPAGRSIDVSPDGRFALSASGWSATLWETATGSEIRTFGASTPDGTPDNTMTLWDLATGQELRKFSGHSKWITSVAFSPNGRYALSGGRDTTIRLWDVATGTEMRQFQAAGVDWLHEGVAVAFSSDGKRIMAGTSGGVQMWSLESGELIASIPSRTETVTFSPTGRFAATANHDEGISLWDMAQGKQIQHFDGHTATINSLAFSNDLRILVSGSDDGTVRIWSVETGRERAQMTMGPLWEWMTLTPDGFFASALRDTRMLNIVRGVETTTIGQIHQSLFNPDLVREALAGDPNNEVKRAALVVNLNQVLNAGPPPAAAVISHAPGSRSGQDLVTVTVRVTDRGKGIGRIEWRVNGVTAGVMQKPAGPGPDYEVQRELALAPGENQIEVIAYEKQNVIASTPARTKILYDGPVDTVKPKLHVLAIGINDYVDQGGVDPADGQTKLFPRLKASALDAVTFSAKIEKAGAGQYAEVRITKALNADATFARLDETLSKLAREISPRDTFVLYAAAHGYSMGGNYYLIPQDYEGGPAPQALASRAISQDRIQDWIANRIKAKKVVILLDTCESGALTAGYMKSRTEGPVAEAAVGRLHEATGRPVITAASGGRSAYEGYKGHGVFTYALMEALHNGDTNGNGAIEVSELAAYVEKRVPELFAELKSNGWVVKGMAQATARGSGVEGQSAHFGSTGEDFAVVTRLP